MFLAMIAPSTAGIHVGGGGGGGASSSAGVGSSGGAAGHTSNGGSAAGHTSNGGGTAIHGQLHHSRHVIYASVNNFIAHGGYYYRCSWINGYRRCGLPND
jgi:hypothetical protein